MLSLIQIKFGGITLPLIDPADSQSTFIYEGAWFGLFDIMHFNISTFSYSAIFYNLVILLPLGIYLSVLFKIKNSLKAFSIVTLTCIGVELIHNLFGKMGLVIGGMTIIPIVIILLINIIRGIIGFLIAERALKWMRSLKNTGEVKLS
ncbi:hypothetical protein [Ureibacillus chungkukjangi]|uniref:hypothetical protein n=1 Tax=Ureibacillus chungkukjangi TaxID=1202712 RepID=UPI001F45CC69|nr:hypothetical protein [Ureibacillus chungkukjangi]